ncbi:MAG: helix-turn-helix transcriptional regulator [Aggregatilineales bacterium]
MSAQALPKDFEGTIGEWIKQRRVALDLTRAELGHQVGCSAEYIRKIEQGIRRPAKDIALRMADMLHLPPEQRDTFIMVVRNLSGTEQGVSSATQMPLRMPVKPIGRARDLSHIWEILTDPDCRLLTIFGPGGIGKTELALAVAKDQAANFPNGALTAMLASVESPGMLPSALTEALSIPLYGGNDLLAEALQSLQEKHLLLILDNFEHLLDAAEMITKILAMAPEVKILVTSREWLKLTDA